MTHQDHSSKDQISEISTFNESRPNDNQSKTETFLKRCLKSQEIRIFKQIFKVGEGVYIKTTNQVDQVAKILNFYSYPQDDKSLVMLMEVQWYCTLYEIPDSQEKQYFSEYELFLTEQTSILFIDCIYSKCSVLTMEEFENTTNMNAYFCRAKYNTNTKVLDPPIDCWKKVCICQKPQNPDQLYIQCDQCHNWFHLTCMGLTQEQANVTEQYNCNLCQQ